jgi:creatinine amidohydrolase
MQLRPHFRAFRVFRVLSRYFRRSAMRITDMNWMQVEEYLKRDDRAVLPTGSVEQHGYLSLSVDNILSERVAVDAAEPLGIPVFPVLAYGISPYFRGFPGSVSLRADTYVHVIRDVLDSIAGSGFKRILIVNGHGGNVPAQSVAAEWMADHPGTAVKSHNWWNAPQTWAKVLEIDPVASHASWMENFPWTRLAGVEMPTNQKPMADLARLRLLDPSSLRAYLGDGNYGGSYQRSDEEMQTIWDVAVAETRALLTGDW